ncbi:MAG: ABC transporter ATP-binding protein [Steroidobacteraceae bacterium]
MSISTVRRMWGLLTPAQHRRALSLLVLMLIGMGLEALGVGAVIPAIALLTQPGYVDRFPVLRSLVAALGNPKQEILVVGGMVTLVGIYLIKTMFLALLAWRQTHFAYAVQTELSHRLFALYLRQPYAFHLQRNSAQLIRNAISEVQHLTGHAMIPAMQLLTEALVLVGLCTLLFVVEPLGALMVVVVLGGSAWGFHRVTRRHILRWGKERIRHDGLRLQHLQQGLGGVKDVKLLGREGEFLGQYRRHNVASARASQLQKTFQQFPRLWLELLAVAGLAALVLAILAQGRALETVLPTMGLFAAAAFRTLPSVNRVLSSMQSLRYGLPVVDILHAELAIEFPAAPASDGNAIQLRRSLQIDGVDYAYPGSRASALSGLSITVCCGESVGFVGPSGAGKSTLVDILLGLLKPDSGCVRVDGVDIESGMRSWQDQIGYVPQTIYLTDDSLRRNVAFGLPNDQIDDQAIARAIQAAQLDEFVRALPGGLETVVGERGIRLSGGQRQRIGIARALYHDPSVLVLDEATSSLDTTTEREVMESVQALKGSKTIIVVAHRLSTVERCHRLYRLVGGKIIQHGTPDEVLRGVSSA